MKAHSSRIHTLTALTILFAQACSPNAPSSRGGRHSAAPRDPLFSATAPQNEQFKEELRYLRETFQLRKPEEDRLESSIEGAARQFGIPRSLLWCVMFQESRFDVLKNATESMGARGIGQFTRTALSELNLATDLFQKGTREYLLNVIKPYALPIAFKLEPPGTVKSQIELRSKRTLPDQPVGSYFRTETSVAATAAYLNNRHAQLMRVLAEEKITFDPEVLWLYAAAAYNKGPRTVYVLITRQRLAAGDESIGEILQSPKMSLALLTHSELLDIALRNVWPTKQRPALIKEMILNLNAVRACATEDKSQ